MGKEPALSLSAEALVGLFFIQRYRFLTINQYAKASGLTPHWVEALLRTFENRGFLGHFGNTPIPGHGKTPKVYYLKRRGWELLRREMRHTRRDARLLPRDGAGSLVVATDVPPAQASTGSGLSTS